MEFNEKDLENVIAGVDSEYAKQFAQKNSSVYRNAQINELKQLKEDIVSKNDELTEEELENVIAGQKRR